MNKPALALASQSFVDYTKAAGGVSGVKVWDCSCVTFHQSWSDLSTCGLYRSDSERLKDVGAGEAFSSDDANT